MIYARHALETGGRVAILADVCGIDVRGVFASSVHPIVARRTVPCNVTVIKFGVIPGVSVVAVITRIRTLDVISRFALSTCAVMA